MVGYAVHYFRDFVLPAKQFRDPTEGERVALTDLRDALSQLPGDATAETIQDVVYEIGRREPFLDHKKPAKDGRPGVTPHCSACRLWNVTTTLYCSPPRSG